MISEAAVEAALTALDQSWIADASREQWGGILRDILEAAAPHMLADAWDDAYAKGQDRGEWEAAPVTEEPKHTNPYRATP